MRRLYVSKHPYAGADLKACTCDKQKMASVYTDDYRTYRVTCQCGAQFICELVGEQPRYN